MNFRFLSRYCLNPSLFFSSSWRMASGDSQRLSSSANGLSFRSIFISSAYISNASQINCKLKDFKLGEDIVSNEMSAGSSREQWGQWGTDGGHAGCQLQSINIHSACQSDLESDISAPSGQDSHDRRWWRFDCDSASFIVVEVAEDHTQLRILQQAERFSTVNATVSQYV